MRATNTASRWYSPVCAISNTRGQFSPSGPGTVHRWEGRFSPSGPKDGPPRGTVLSFRAGGGSPMGDSSHLSGRGLFTDGRDGSHLLGRGTVHRWEGRFSAFGQGNGSPMGGTVLTFRAGGAVHRWGTVLTFRTEGRSAEGDSSHLPDRETYTDGKLPRGKEQDDEDTYYWRRRA